MDSLKILSPTYTVALTTDQISALQLEPNTPTRAFRVAALNTGSGTAAVTFGTTASNVPNATIASANNGGSFVLAPNMFYPLVLDCGAPNVFVKGVSSSTNTLYLTLVATE